MTIVLLTFLGILAIVLVPYWAFVVRQETTEQRDLRKRLKTSIAKVQARPELLQAETPLSNVVTVDRVLKKTRLVSGPVRDRIAQANMNVTVGTVILASAFLGITTAVVSAWLGAWIVVALPLGLAAATLPYLALNFAASRRRDKFEEQFPEAIELLSRALRAGHAFTTGLQMVADEMPEPVGAEFRLVYDRQAFGMPITDALRDMARRVPLLDARFFVTAVLTQRESGGNLAEVLDNLATIMRERFTVKRQVRTLSAHGRMTAVVLLCLPPALAVLMTLIAPQHMGVMVTDPLGQGMVAGAIILQVLGIMVIRRIITIEV